MSTAENGGFSLLRMNACYTYPLYPLNRVDGHMIGIDPLSFRQIF